MRWKCVLCFCVVFVISACNLSAQQAASPSPTPSAAPPPATRAPSPTASPPRTPTLFRPNLNRTLAPAQSCPPRSGWTGYTVQPGDTLFSIARRAGTSQDLLMTANCLQDADRIDVGQRLQVPLDIQMTETEAAAAAIPSPTPSPSPSPPPNTVRLWWLADSSAAADETSTADAAGCALELVPGNSEIPDDLSTLDTLNRALTQLSGADSAAPAGALNLIAASDLRAASYRIENDHAVIHLEGTLVPPGDDCASRRLGGQLAMNLLSLTKTESATILFDDDNLRQALDASGRETRRTYSQAALQAGDEQTILFWVGSDSDYQSTGIVVGCASYLLPVDTQIPRSDSLTDDLILALAALFDAQQNHPALTETYDWLKGLGLSIKNITLDADSAVIDLNEGLMGIGTCGDAILEAQILQTLFQFETLERVKVSDGRMNLRQVTDMSDRLSLAELQDYVYVHPAVGY